MRQLHIDRRAARPIFLQIVEELEQRLAAGEIPDGTRLPASRDLARDLQVNRNTVVSAYQELVARGRAIAHTGRGTFLRAGPPAGDHGTILWDETMARPAEAGVRGAALELHGLGSRDGAISFADNFPPEDLLPVEAFRTVLDEIVRREGPRLLTYGSPAGYPPLRQWIAREMSHAGTEIDPDSVIITSGSQQAIDLSARALVDPGDRVLMEEPGFPLAIGAFAVHGAAVEGIEIDRDGMRPDRLARALARSRAKLIYLVPNFQNPTGVCLSLARRTEVLELARRHRVAVVEDDSSGALRFAGMPLPPLHTLDRHGIVLYVSTFSKKLLPGLRVGWMSAPQPVRDRLVALKQMADCTTSLLLQAALHEFCRRGLLEEHLSRVNRIFGERRDAMLESMQAHFPEGVSWTEPEGGLILWVTLPPEVDARDVLFEAGAEGVVFNPGDLFYIDSPRRNHLRLTFGGSPPGPTRQGVRRLGKILRRILDRSRGQRRALAEAGPLV